MIAYITGATSGFGKAIALKLAQQKYDLILTGRREERLKELEKEIITTYKRKVLTLTYDVRQRETTLTINAQLPEQWKQIDVLVNNAGLAAGLSPIQEGDIDDWDCMIDTNVKGLLYVTRSIAPLMIARGKGHIINIGSIAGKEVYPNGNVYCGSKFAVDALTKAMRIDMLQAGIKVTQIAPGAAETEFSLVRFKGDKTAADKVYQGYTPLSGEDIAEVLAFVLSLPEHVCLNDIVITPTAQASATYFNRK
ncbi:MAG TPA: SDR family NAD(P)-dependent oxidoreductase [Bacteroidales bacterium]|jgi:3-hydroxy acid dehydrogenase/malonic semialdehyde reductase|nr:SDR family NAD(P)-dependent oxidoreductase [Bacteroidales bacterium]HOF16338.1 SDR family NAD(P)-dependent oxidoreductase [Bacteroidales bacterium]HON20378.1 SDR family NAD(P)-dependent oxidoreductase [Bacteroidales bacterium]HOR81912.1 SDR family NAD(P)-dependent oxidoreductase [Bacteroidales bacterium]HPJ91144.1 SDR family NAD(P)-dependent oxidoreductase [Bacteroidales bacterium]